MNVRYWVSVLLALSLFLAGCGAGTTTETDTTAEADTTAETEDSDTTAETEENDTSEDDAAEGSDTDAPDLDEDMLVFRLGDNTVTVADFQERLEEELGPPIMQLMMQGQTREQVEELAQAQNVRQSVLDNMIQEELLLQIAGEEGIGVDAEAVDQAVEQQEAMGALSGDPTGEGDGGMTEEERTELRERVSRQQRVGNVIAQHTTADMFNSKHILVDDEETAEEVLAQLEEGEDFADLASEYSQDPGSAENGGEYGWVARGTFVPEYEEFAFDAELNEPGIVESQFGFHVIVVEDREEDRPFDSIDELSNAQNAQQYYEESFVPWYEEQREEAIESGQLEINEDFNPASVPLPIPDESELPEMPAPPEIELPPMPEDAPTPPADAEEPPDAELPPMPDDEEAEGEDTDAEDTEGEDGDAEDTE